MRNRLPRDPPIDADRGAAAGDRHGLLLVTVLLAAAAATDLSRCCIVVVAARHGQLAAGLIAAGLASAALSLAAARGSHRGRGWASWAAVLIGITSAPQAAATGTLMLAIIGGSPARFAPFSELFGQALERFGRAPLPVGVHSPGHVAATDEQALDEFWPRYLEVISRYSQIRGFAIPTRQSFVREVGPHGALYVGSPETVARKIAANLTALGANRFDLKYGMGGLSHETLMTNIELYGTQVIPRVRELVAERTLP